MRQTVLLSVVVAWASKFVHHVHCFLSRPVGKDVYAIMCLKKKKKRTKWCKSHSSGSPKRSLLSLKDVKHAEGTIHDSHFSRCGHIIQRNAALLSSAFPGKVFSVRPQSHTRSGGVVVFFFSQSQLPSLPSKKKTPTCSREPFMRRDSPHSGMSELIRRITCRSRPPRGSRGAAAIRHRSPACRKDSSSGLLAVRLPLSAEEDCGSITHHRAAHRH